MLRNSDIDELPKEAGLFDSMKKDSSKDISIAFLALNNTVKQAAMPNNTPRDWRDGSESVFVSQQKVVHPSNTSSRSSSDTRSVTSGNSSRTTFVDSLHLSQKATESLGGRNAKQYQSQNGSGLKPKLADCTKVKKSLPELPAVLLKVGRQSSDTLPSAFRGRFAHSSNDPFSVIQSSDEGLDAAGLRQTISDVRVEKERLVKQFEGMEMAMLAEADDDPSSSVIHETVVEGTVKAGGEFRRTSMSTIHSQYSYSSIMNETSRRGPSVSNHTRSLLRRPSLFPSLFSTSSSGYYDLSRLTGGGRENSISSRHGGSSNLPGLQEDLAVSCIAAYSFSREDCPTMSKELARLVRRRSNVEEKYQARLEYLEARLRAREIQDKLLKR